MQNKNHLNEIELAGFADALYKNEVSKLPEDLRMHVKNCYSCKQEVLEAYTMLEAIRSENQGVNIYPGLTPSSDFRKTELNLRLMAAVALIFFITGGILLLLFIKYPGASESVEIKQSQENFPSVALEDDLQNKKDSVVSKAKDVLLADRYVPSPDMDNLAGEYTRSEMITILSPKAGELFNTNDSVVFHVNLAETLHANFILLNNVEHEIIRKEMKNSFFLKIIPEPGLYYWKIQTEEELLYLGKFTVR